MSYVIQDRIEVSVLFGELNYPLGQLNSLNFLHMGSSIRMLVPTLCIGITDQMGIMNTGILKDGLQIRVVIKPVGSTESMTHRFVLSGLKYTNTGMGTQFTVYGYGGNTLYFAGTSTEGIRASSNEVIEQIANRCGLTYDGTDTNDVQLWMPQNRLNSVFARRTAGAGYVDNRSLMKLGLCMNGTLRYKNLNSVTDLKLRLLQGKTEKGFLPIVDHAPKVENGSSNVFSGYALQRFKQSTETPGVEDTLTFIPDSRTPMIDVEMKSRIKRGLADFGPLDFGNTNESYDKALYQNRRYSSLYSVGCDFLTVYHSGLLLLDRIEFTGEQESGETNDSVTGQYVVSGHAILVQGPNYYEKIEGFRQGTNWSSNGN